MVFVIGLTMIASGGAIYLILEEPKESKSLPLNEKEMGPGWYTYYKFEREEGYYPEFQWYLDTELRKNSFDQRGDPFGWEWHGTFIHIEIGLANSSGSSKQFMESCIPNTALVVPSKIGDGGWYIYDEYLGDGGFYCGFTEGRYYVYMFLGYGTTNEVPTWSNVCIWPRFKPLNYLDGTSIRSIKAPRS